MAQIMQHDWFVQNLPIDLVPQSAVEVEDPFRQSDEEINSIVEEAKVKIRETTNQEMQMEMDIEDDDDMFGSIDYSAGNADDSAYDC